MCYYFFRFLFFKHIPRIYRQKIRQKPLLDHMGIPLLKSTHESMTPDMNQNAMPLVNRICIPRDIPSTFFVLYTCRACGTWQIAILMPAIAEVIVNKSSRFMLYSHFFKCVYFILCIRR